MSETYDDFADFFSGTYAEVLEAFLRVGLEPTVQAGAAGHYLLVARVSSRSPQAQVGPVPWQTSVVEVTADGRPLPGSPADIINWVLTRKTPTGVDQQIVPQSAGLSALASVAQRMVHRLAGS